MKTIKLTPEELKTLKAKYKAYTDCEAWGFTMEDTANQFSKKDAALDDFNKFSNEMYAKYKITPSQVQGVNTKTGEIVFK